MHVAQDAGNIKFTVSATAKRRTGVDENNNPAYENVTIEPAECQKIIVYVDGKKQPGSNAFVPAAAGLLIAREVIVDLTRYDEVSQ